MSEPTGELLEFSRNLKKLRQESGLSQEALAELIGTSNTTICRYENGRQAPTKYHRAMLAEVFGVPGYSLFEDDFVPKAYLPDVIIRTQERLRHAMLTDDFEYVDELIYKIHKSTDEDCKKVTLTQAKNFLRCWSFYHQGASAEQTLSQLISCMRLTRPCFSINAVCNDEPPDTPLTYTEAGILNSIGVILIRTGECRSALRMFALLIKESDSTLLATERRFFQKCVFGLNLSLALRQCGQMHRARQLLLSYHRDAYLYGTPAICIRLQIGMYRCLDHTTPLYNEERNDTLLFHRVLRSTFGLKKKIHELERECDKGIMVL